MMPTALSALLLGLATASVTASIGVDKPFIISVTASSEMSKQNIILAFDPTNVTNQFGNAEFKYFESALCSSYDKAGGRYFVLLEGAIAVFEPTTLAETASIPYSLGPAEYWPDTMHYDAKNDSLWLLTNPYPGVMRFCSTPATFNTTGEAAKLVCHDNLNDKYVYLAGSSAFDNLNDDERVIWVGLTKELPQKGTVLIGFNVDTLENIPAVAINDACQNMQVVQVDGTTGLVCVNFKRNELVHLDSATGKFTSIRSFPMTHDPTPYSSAVALHADGKSSTYYALLSGSIDYQWVAIDVKTGKQAGATTEIAKSALPGHLALSQYSN